MTSFVIAPEQPLAYMLPRDCSKQPAANTNSRNPLEQRVPLAPLACFRADILFPDTASGLGSVPLLVYRASSAGEPAFHRPVRTSGSGAQLARMLLQWEHAGWSRESGGLTPWFEKVCEQQTTAEQGEQESPGRSAKGCLDDLERTM